MFRSIRTFESMKENISLNIPAEHAAPLVEYYTNRLQSILNEAESINSILAQLTGTTRSYIKVPSSMGDVQAPDELIKDGYNSRWSNPAKAKYFIQKEGRKLSNAEIVDNILKHEPQLDRAKLIGSMSSVLGSKAKEGKEFIREEDEYGNFIYNVIEKAAGSGSK